MARLQSRAVRKPPHTGLVPIICGCAGGNGPLRNEPVTVAVSLTDARRVDGGDSGAFDGVLWLEQVRTTQPVANFQGARETESAHLPMPQ